MRLLLTLVIACASSACVMSGRLYDLENGAVLPANYRDSGSGKGRIWLGPSEKAATCSGEYRTIPQGSMGWGNIYSGGNVSTVSTMLTSTDQPGVAVVSCSDGKVIECEYVASAVTGGGSGRCQDNRGRRYRLMF